ncbi:ComEA family DNA-binding protein [Streptomyces sp. NPDC001985]|uniref:ComEA family DNA-binding protein n=1 Tax=Streptomyces sp. NPDC001985 TaxID=3154406 RepID=UPI00332EE836
MTPHPHPATSGPGRPPASDSRAHPRLRTRVRHGPGPGPGRGTTARRRGEVPPTAPAPDPPPGTDHPLRQRAVFAVRERLPVWVRLRCGLEPRTLAALAVVLVAAALLAVQHFWTGNPESVRAPEVVRPGVAAPERAPEAARRGSGRVVVDVSGKVRRPGVLRLPNGSRVADALRAAGGVRTGADLTGLNRARVLIDGEQVVVGAPAPPSAPGADTAPPGPATVPSTGPLSLNAATADQLETLPGVGPVLARHIIDHRTQQGGFRSVEQLREVRGIGDRRFADLQPLVRP